jgi:hypothetical protein
MSELTVGSPALGSIKTPLEQHLRVGALQFAFAVS